MRSQTRLHCQPRHTLATVTCVLATIAAARSHVGDAAPTPSAVAGFWMSNDASCACHGGASPERQGAESVAHACCVDKLPSSCGAEPSGRGAGLQLQLSLQLGPWRIGERGCCSRADSSPLSLPPLPPPLLSQLPPLLLLPPLAPASVAQTSTVGAITTIAA